MFEERLKQELPEVYDKYLSNKKWFLDRISCIIRFKRKSYHKQISQLQEKRLFKYLESDQ